MPPESKSPRFTLSDWGVILGAVTTGAIGGAYISHARDGAQLAKYEMAEELQLDKSLAELRSLTVSLKPAIEERKAVAKVPVLEARVRELERSNASLTAHVVRLKHVEAVIAREPKAINIPLGEVRYAIPNALVFSAERVVVYRHACDLKHSGKSASLVVGDAMGGHDPKSGLDYEFTLTKATEAGCTIDFKVVDRPTEAS